MDIMTNLLSFQVLMDRKVAARKSLKLEEEEERLTADTIAV
jgi:hypothetical protein